MNEKLLGGLILSQDKRKLSESILEMMSSCVHRK